MLNLLYLLPKNLISRWVGVFVHIRWPKPLSTWSIQIFSQIYNINQHEAEKPISDYKSIGDFFTRRLITGARPLQNQVLIHPADSRITQLGEIKNGVLIQAKNKIYIVEKFLANPQTTSLLEGGLFCTYYLCPTDYHRVHSPVSGKIMSVTHISGNLWPVNEWSTENIAELFCVNERVVVEIESELGPAFVVLVGATNVGKITLSFDPDVVSNQAHLKSLNHRKYANQKINIGDELGTFHMGSTVVMLYGAKYKALLQKVNLDIFLNQKAYVGQSFLGGPPA